MVSQAQASRFYYQSIYFSFLYPLFIMMLVYDFDYIDVADPQSGFRLHRNGAAATRGDAIAARQAGPRPPRTPSFSTRLRTERPSSTTRSGRNGRTPSTLSIIQSPIACRRSSDRSSRWRAVGTTSPPYFRKKRRGPPRLYLLIPSPHAHSIARQCNRSLGRRWSALRSELLAANSITRPGKNRNETPAMIRPSWRASNSLRFAVSANISWNSSSPIIDSALRRAHAT